MIWGSADAPVFRSPAHLTPCVAPSPQSRVRGAAAVGPVGRDVPVDRAGGAGIHTGPAGARRKRGLYWWNRFRAEPKRNQSSCESL